MQTGGSGGIKSKYMKKILFLIIGLFLFTSCISQEKSSLKVEGNWATVYDKDTFDDYFEMYFSKDSIFYYSATGLSSSIYKIKGSYFFTKTDKSKDFEKKSKILMAQDTLYLNEGKYQVKLYRITDGITLEEFLNETVDENQYNKAFEDRVLELTPVGG